MSENSGKYNVPAKDPAAIILIYDFFGDGRPLFQDDLACGHDDGDPD
jgi:hypothetical protein